MKNNLTVRCCIAFICLFAFSSSVISAQENFKPGHVITKDNTRIDGWIDFRDWSKSPDNINFKASGTDDIINYSPLELTAFEVQDQYYLGQIVEIEKSPILKDRIDEELDAKAELRLEKDTLFVKRLLKGDKELYMARNYLNIKNYYIKDGKKLDLLLFKNYFEKKDGSGRIKSLDLYKSQLQNYFEDCRNISSDIQKADYIEKDLRDLFMSYSKCSKSSTIISTKQDKDSRFRVLAGLTFTNLIFNSDMSNNSLVVADFQPSIDPLIGFALSSPIGGDLNKLYFEVQAFYSQYNVIGDFETTVTQDNFSTGTYSLGFGQINLEFDLRYKLLKRNFLVYPLAGIGASYITNEIINKRVTTQTFFTDVTTRETVGISDGLKYGFSFFVGAGIDFKKFGVELKYRLGTGLITGEIVKSRIQGLMLVGSYKF